MTFEETMESLGAELGVPLSVEDGKACFEAVPAGGGDVIEIDFKELLEGVVAVMSADLGEMPKEGAEALMKDMLEANHLFDGTGGATFSVDDGRIKLERYVRFEDLGRGEGANAVMPFIAKARRWADNIAAKSGGVEGPDDGGEIPMTGSGLMQV